MSDEQDEIWIEWGVKRERGDGSIANFERDYRTARRCAKEWPGQLVSRAVVASEWLSGRAEGDA